VIGDGSGVPRGSGVVSFDGFNVLSWMSCQLLGKHNSLNMGRAGGLKFIVLGRVVVVTLVCMIHVLSTNAPEGRVGVEASGP